MIVDDILGSKIIASWKISIALILFFATCIGTATVFKQANFFYLASSFAQGKLYIGTASSPDDYRSNSSAPGDQLHNDLAYYHGKLYVALGPLPALLYLPFMPIIQTFNWWILHAWSLLLFNLINLALLLRLGRLLKLNFNQQLWIAFAFMVGSSYIGVGLFSHPSALGHVIATMWVLAALTEYFDRRRYWFIGILMGLGMATRLSVGIGVLFFIFSALGDPLFHAIKVTSTKYHPVWNVIQLVIPFGVMFVLIGMYNYARFDNFFESGYSYQLIQGSMKEARDYALLSLQHVPHNLYYFFFGLPHLLRDETGVSRFPYFYFDGLGLSILFTSGYLLVLATMRRIDWLTIKVSVTSLAVFSFLMMLFSSGQFQYGYRFFLDFAPFIYCLLMAKIGSGEITLSRSLKSAILVWACVNYYLAVVCTFPILARLP